MRLPNGYGSVYKLSGHRRRPYVVKRPSMDGSVPWDILSRIKLRLNFSLRLITAHPPIKSRFPPSMPHGVKGIFRMYPCPAVRPTPSATGI